MKLNIIIILSETLVDFMHLSYILTISQKNFHFYENWKNVKFYFYLYIVHMQWHHRYWKSCQLMDPYDKDSWNFENS